MKITKLGIEFNYQLDKVLYIWPWKRNSRGKYLAIYLSNQDYEARFDTLKEIGEAREDFQNAAIELDDFEGIDCLCDWEGKK
jgi:hypothetical protein